MSASDEKVVPQEAISKALESLQNLAKGHTSGQTANTKVESMRDAGAGAGSSAGATQVFHTPSNSDPGSWAGSVARDVPEDGATDAIDANGTDYNGGAQMVKSILQKLAKGQTLTAEEYALIKGKFGKDEDEDEDEGKVEKAQYSKDDGDDDEAKKSLSDHAQAHEEVRKGLEMSSFLGGWVDTQSEALRSTESRMVSSINKSLRDLGERSEAFNAELAKSVAALAEVMSLQAQRIEQLESTPARGPKSMQGVQPVEKSFNGQPGGDGEQLTKSQVLDTLVDMVEKGNISATEVVRFESTKQLTPELEQRVLAHRNGR